MRAELLYRLLRARSVRARFRSSDLDVAAEVAAGDAAVSAA